MPPANRATKRANVNGTGKTQAQKIAELENRIARLEPMVEKMYNMIRTAYDKQIQAAASNPEVRAQLVDQAMSQQMGDLPPGLTGV